MGVFLEYVRTTLTLPFLHLPHLLSNHRSKANWNIDLRLKASKLKSLNVTKIEFMIVHSRQKLQSLNEYTINNVEGVQVNQTTHSKSLELNIDENLP